MGSGNRRERQESNIYLWHLGEKWFDFVAAQGSNGNGGKLSQTVLALVVATVTATATLTGTYYGTRDTLERDIRASVAQEQIDEHAYLTMQLQHYLSLEQFLNWRQAWEVKRSEQYFSLLNAIEAAKRGR